MRLQLPKAGARHLHREQLHRRCHHLRRPVEHKTAGIHLFKTEVRNRRPMQIAGINQFKIVPRSKQRQLQLQQTIRGEYQFLVQLLLCRALRHRVDLAQARLRKPLLCPAHQLVSPAQAYQKIQLWIGCPMFLLKDKRLQDKTLKSLAGICQFRSA